MITTDDLLKHNMMVGGVFVVAVVVNTLLWCIVWFIMVANYSFNMGVLVPCGVTAALSTMVGYMFRGWKKECLDVSLREAGSTELAMLVARIEGELEEREHENKELPGMS